MADSLWQYANQTTRGNYARDREGLSGGGTDGTLSSQGLYQTPGVPGTSQRAGLEGTDGLGYTRTVQGNELVRNQLNDLTRSNSEYMQNASRRGMEAANRRGLMNSSIAGGMAQRAALEAAMPIASQDASTYDRAAGANLSAMNENLMQSRDIMNRVTEAKMARDAQLQGYDVQRDIAGLNNQSMLQRQRENLAYEGEQAGLTRQQQEYMARLGYDMESGLMGQGYGYDLGRGNQSFQNQAGLLGLGYGYDLGRGNQSYQNQAGLLGLGLQADLTRGLQGYGFDLGRGNQQHGFNLDMLGAGLNADLIRGDQGYQHDIGRMGAEFNFGTARDASQAQIQDWLSGNQFNREFMGGLATMSFANRQDQFNQLWSAVLNDPEVYGNQEFLQNLQNNLNNLGGTFDQMLARMFGGG